MRALPVGVPKVLASTVASGNVAPYVGTKDVAMLYSVVDIAGLNRLSRAVLTNAAGAVCGAVEAAAQHAHQADAAEKPLLAASMFGNTTELVDAARAVFEQQGYEVLVFHATGSGGQTMEGLIRDGFIAGVYDVTTTEWADQLCGGVFSAGPTRLDARRRARHSPGDCAGLPGHGQLRERSDRPGAVQRRSNTQVLRVEPGSDADANDRGRERRARPDRGREGQRRTEGRWRSSYRCKASLSWTA